ncbi:GNAT family N-acetyltransferase [Nocardioides sp. CFH 31398]|uniref:GNAT family N-acetyltransferase n=1 Tax=Nocardioides sp. CFH 31398 TaxID=2919579 RepID=UPI001F05EFF4|nr:GNAT family N-acetyltransferase [Nocardioides sp. CFH 31398]MCH1867347.1 acetyltransferase [Nocardioides sp. CFH 31398]
MTSIEPLDHHAHADLLHAWVTHPRSVYWQMQGLSRAEVVAAYDELAADAGHDCWLGWVDGRQAFLTETYDPATAKASEVRDRPELRPGDLGMHVLVAPPGDGEAPVPGFTRRCFAAVMTHCFDDPAVERVVVEPDARNDAIRRLNAEAGFVVLGEVPLGSKTAALSVCDRDGWLDSTLAGVRP